MLLVSYSFPPDSSMGSVRWEKLVAHAASRGWTVDVLAMDPAEASLRDDSRLTSLPEGTRVFAVPLPDHPYLKLERWLRRPWQRRDQSTNPATSSPDRGITVVPERPNEADTSLLGRLRALRRAQLAWLYYDQWLRWCDSAEQVGASLVARNTYAVVVSSGPPQMAHEAARRIARHMGLPHVMDLRDMWHGPTAEPWDFLSPTWRRLSERYERACVEGSSLVIANTPAIEAILRSRYPLLADRFLTVMNGADPDVGNAPEFATRFTLIHAGELYNGRDPRSLLRGFRLAIETIGATPEQICLRFLGAEDYEGVSLRKLAADAGVEPFVRAEAKVPRPLALQALGESAVLVILPQNQVECVPGKVFEYVQMPSWLLAISEEGTATEMLLRDTTAAVIAPDDVPEIGRYITRRYEEFRRGVRPAPVNSDGRLDRSRQADRLFDALDNLVSRASTSGGPVRSAQPDLEASGRRAS